MKIVATEIKTPLIDETNLLQTKIINSATAFHRNELGGKALFTRFFVLFYIPFHKSLLNTPTFCVGYETTRLNLTITFSIISSFPKQLCTYTHFHAFIVVTIVCCY